jgi:hypothetical protein
MTICPNPRRWFPRCKFKPRYSSGPAQPVTPEQIAALDELVLFSEDIVRAVVALAHGGSTYEGEVCTMCGMFIRGEDQKR